MLRELGITHIITTQWHPTLDRFVTWVVNYNSINSNINFNGKQKIQKIQKIQQIQQIQQMQQMQTLAYRLCPRVSDILR